MANNYTLGRGEIYFDRYADGTETTTGERYVGNTPALSLNITVDTLDHYSSDRGIKEKDAQAVLQVTRKGTMQVDNIDNDNMAIFFFGSAEVLSTSSSTVTDEVILGILPGYSYQLGTSPTLPAGVRNVSAVTVKDGTAGTTTYVLGTDYTLDADLGRITPLAGGAIVKGSSLKVSYTVGAHTRDRIISGSDPVNGAMRFITTNPVGLNRDIFMPKVTLTPNGDYALKGDEWQVMEFNVEVLKKSNLEAFYVDGRPSTTP